MSAAGAASCSWCRGPLALAEGAWWCRTTAACRARQVAWALQRPARQGQPAQWLYVPTPKQVAFHEQTRQTRRTLYGGQAGPGKSHALRWGLYRDCLATPNLNCLLLRRTFSQLDQTHLGQMVREQHLLGTQYVVGEKTMRFPNGSVIRAGHCETAADAVNYLSTEYDRIAFDELVTFDRDAALEIMSRARTSKPEVIAAGDAQVWAGSNPGGRGALWVKEFFIDHVVDPAVFPSYDPARYGFVEATLDDNPWISPAYRRDLEELPEIRKRQLLYGDWMAFEGQFFAEWQAARGADPWHVRALPDLAGDTATVIGGMDWGHHAPGVMLWLVVLPDGRLHVLHEFKFQRMTVEEVGAAIRAETTRLGVKLSYIACDPAMFQRTGQGPRGESIAETLLRMRLPMRRADHNRFLGWMRLHEVLRPHADGHGPMLTVDPRCAYGIRTLPALVQDPHNPDDVDTTKDDHWADALRYAIMSRPSAPATLGPDAPPPNSWGWWESYHRAQERRGALA